MSELDLSPKDTAIILYALRCMQHVEWGQPAPDPEEYFTLERIQFPTCEEVDELCSWVNTA